MIQIVGGAYRSGDVSLNLLRAEYNALVYAAPWTVLVSQVHVYPVDEVSVLTQPSV